MVDIITIVPSHNIFNIRVDFMAMIILLWLTEYEPEKKTWDLKYAHLWNKIQKVLKTLFSSHVYIAVWTVSKANRL